MAQAVLDSPALEGFAGELVRDGDPAYDDLRRVFNAAIDRRPALIACCSGVADVMAALAYAREQGLDVSVRGGGHSVAGHAVVDGGLMIDLRPMSRVRVDPEEKVAWCGGGANWGQLDRETQAFGLAVTGGGWPTPASAVSRSAAAAAGSSASTASRSTACCRSRPSPPTAASWSPAPIATRTCSGRSRAAAATSAW